MESVAPILEFLPQSLNPEQLLKGPDWRRGTRNDFSSCAVETTTWHPGSGIPEAVLESVSGWD